MSRSLKSFESTRYRIQSNIKLTFRTFTASVGFVRKNKLCNSRHNARINYATNTVKIKKIIADFGNTFFNIFIIEPPYANPNNTISTADRIASISLSTISRIFGIRWVNRIYRLICVTLSPTILASCSLLRLPPAPSFC